MQTNGRNQNGRFAKGNPGGPGRQPVAAERRYVETMSTVCTVEDWRDICRRAVADAKNGDHRARDWLSKYLIGEPDAAAGLFHGNPPSSTTGLGDNPSMNLSPEALIQAKAAIARLVENGADPVVSDSE